jgi:hypothetical protein
MLNGTSLKRRVLSMSGELLLTLHPECDAYKTVEQVKVSVKTAVFCLYCI